MYNGLIVGACSGRGSVFLQTGGAPSPGDTAANLFKLFN